MDRFVEISYNGFCALGGLTNPRLSTRDVRDARGDFLYTKYLYQNY